MIRQSENMFNLRRALMKKPNFPFNYNYKRMSCQYYKASMPLQKALPELGVGEARGVFFLEFSFLLKIKRPYFNIACASIAF